MKKRKPIRRASTHYGPWHVMLASPDKPMQPSRYRHQLTRMHLAMASITSGESPTDEDWRLIADAINLVETLVLQGVAQDESGLLHDAITAMAEAFYRADQDSARMRLTGPGLTAIRAVLADWVHSWSSYPSAPSSRHTLPPTGALPKSCAATAWATGQRW